MANTDVFEEMARWRLAYDTVSALAARLSGNRHPPMTTHHGEHEDQRSTPTTGHQHHHPGSFDSGQVTIGGPCCSAHVGDVPSIADFDTTMSQRNDDAILGMSDRLGHQMPSPTVAGNRSVTPSTVVYLQSATTTLPVTRGREYDVDTTPSSPVVASSSQLPFVLDDRLPAGETVIASEAFDLPHFRSTVMQGVVTVPRAVGANDLRVTRPVASSVDGGVSVGGPTSGTTRYTRTPTVDRDALPMHRSPFPFEADTLLELFDRLTDTFYSETFLWIYLNAVGRPSARRLRHCLRLLGAASGRSLAQATVNVLTGYMTGYRQSRHALSGNVESALRRVSSSVERGGESGSDARQQQQQQQDQAALLGRLAVELGVALNPRQMFRSFSAVVRDLLARTTSATTFSTAAGRQMPPSTRTFQSDHPAHGYESRHNPFPRDVSDQHHWHPHHHRNHHQLQQQQQQQILLLQQSSQLTRHGSGTSSHVRAVGSVPITSHPERHVDSHLEERVHSGSGRRRRSSSISHEDDDISGIIPPPPPPYPSFLLHFLTMLAAPSVQSLASHETTSAADAYSYEALIALGDQLGEVKRHGLSSDVIQQLPVYVFDNGAVGHRKSSSYDSCVICLEKFISGHSVRVLPCRHEYHAKCVDRWLQINGSCPVCRFQIGV